MINPVQVAVVIGIILMIFNIVRSFYYFYLKNDVTLANTGWRKALTIILLILMIVVCVESAVSANSIPTVASYSMLIGAILYTLTLHWMFAQLDGMKERSMNILETLMSILEVGEPTLDGHLLHVHNLTVLLYDYLPPEKQRKINRQDLQYASLFNDIGKLGIPGRIINKPGKLGSDEWKLIKTHPDIATRILLPIGSFDTISKWIKYHHERMDGNGYFGLKGEEIPLASRMIAVADTYSAITMTRSYRPTLSYEDAISELQLVAGSQLDPELVSIFVNIPKNRVLACMEDVEEKMTRYQNEKIEVK